MFKRLIFIPLILCSLITTAGTLWHCSARNKMGAVWNDFGKTKSSASKMVQLSCKKMNNNHSCRLTCFPPRTYYRCVAHDTPKKGMKPGSWYWTSFSQIIAEHGAADACRHNSLSGGCYVDNKACASS